MRNEKKTEKRTKKSRKNSFSQKAADSAAELSEPSPLSLLFDFFPFFEKTLFFGLLTGKITVQRVLFDLSSKKQQAAKATVVVGFVVSEIGLCVKVMNRSLW